ncbi:hypothetical protein D3C80_845520 [compost metagenome]
MAGLVEQVTHPGGTHAHEHLHELRAGDREKWHRRFPGDGLGDQGLAGAGWAYQQRALGHMGAKARIPRLVFQEGHDLGQLALDVVDTGHVGESHLGVVFDIDPRTRLAHPHQPAQPLFLPQAMKQEVPQRQHHQQRHQRAHHGRYRVALDDARERDSRSSQLLAQSRVDANGGEYRVAIDRLLQSAEDPLVLDMQVADLLLIE